MPASTPFVTCLVASPGDEETRIILREIASRYEDSALWLARDRALEVPSHASSTADIITGIVGGANIDTATLEARGRRKQLFVADMDSTMITIECIDELASLVGVRSHVAEITERAMAGKLNFSQALYERVRCLEGVSLSDIETICHERVRAMRGACELISTMRQVGTHTVLVSGGFRQFTTYVARLLGFDQEFGNELEVHNGCLTGRIIGPVLDAKAKRKQLVASATELGIAITDTMAVGDGANDRDMVREAGLGVAYRGKAILTAVADISIQHSDLTALLYFQGYRESEIIVGRPSD